RAGRAARATGGAAAAARASHRRPDVHDRSTDAGFRPLCQSRPAWPWLLDRRQSLCERHYPDAGQLPRPRTPRHNADDDAGPVHADQSRPGDDPGGPRPERRRDAHVRDHIGSAHRRLPGRRRRAYAPRPGAFYPGTCRRPGAATAGAMTPRVAGLLALGVAACSGQGGGNGSRAEAQAGVAMRPGLWETSYRILSIDLPNAPPEIVEGMRAGISTAPVTERACLSPAEAAEPAAAVR